MATYRDLQDKILLDYLNRTDLIPETKRAITSAIRTYEANRYWFNEAATAVATIASQSYIDIPTDMLSPLRVEVFYSGGWAALGHTSFSEVRQMNAVAVPGQPTQYAYYGDRFELDTLPDSAYDVNVYYLRSLPTLSADSDTNAWTTEAFNLIAHTAVLDIMMGVIQEPNPVKIANHVQCLTIARNELDARNTGRISYKLSSTKF